ncbi:hypothetical protein Tco_0965893 [Tanacetum coccineum]
MHQVAMPERQTLSYVGNCSTSDDHIARTYTQSNKIQCLKQQMLLAQLQEAGIQLSKDQLAILADTEERIDFGPGALTVTTNALFQADKVEVYDSDCDDLPSAQPSFMANISSSDLDVLSEINLDNKSINDTLTTELERYKEQVKVLKEGQNVEAKNQDNVVDSHEQNAEIERLKQTLSEQLKEKESLMKTIIVLKNDFKKEESRNIDREITLEKKIKLLDNIVYKRDQSAQTVHIKLSSFEPNLYDGNVIKNTSDIVILDSEETLILAEESRSKMLLKQQDLDVISKKNSMNSSEPNPSCTPTKVGVPKELPTVSMVNTSLKKLKHHLAGFDMVVKERTTTTTITEGTWGFEHTKACFRDEIIPFVKALKDIYNKFNQYLIDELTAIQNVFSQIEQAVEQHLIRKLKERIKSLSGNVNEENVKKNINEIESINIELEHNVAKLISVNENLRNEREHLKSIFKDQFDSIKQTCVQSKEHSDSLIAQINAKSVENLDLNAQLQEKVDLELLSSKLKNNREAGVDYIRITKENADTLCDIIEEARTSNPLDNALAYACMYTKQIQELLVYVSDTCPSSPLKSEKLVAVTLMNKARKVTFAKTSTTSDNNT